MAASSRLPPAPRGRTAVPYIVLAFSLTLTAVATGYVAAEAERKDRRRFEIAVTSTLDAIEERLHLCIASLRGTAALIASNPDVTREQFKAYVERLHLQQDHAGTQRIGFSVRVLPKAKATLIAAMRRQDVPVFHIWPEDARNEYHPIIYLEPLSPNNQAAIGYDMSTDPVRRTAMELARDTGLPVASGKVTLLQEIDRHQQPGFLIYLPVYRAGIVPQTVSERAAALQGFVYSPFRADDLLAGIFEREIPGRTDVEIFDGSESTSEHLLHSSLQTAEERASADHAPAAPRPRFRSTASINVAGRTWTLSISNTPESELAFGTHAVPLVLLIGLAFSLALFGVTRDQVKARLNAERFADHLWHSEAALRESDLRLRRLMESNIIGLIIADRSGNILEANDAFLQMVGRARKELEAGQVNRVELTPPEFRHLYTQAVDELRRTGRHTIYEKEFLRSDGTHIPVLVGTAYLGGPGELVVGFIIDLTERKHAEEAQRFLAEASKALGSSLDYHATLDSVARLTVPRFADWCIVHLVQEDGSLQLSTVVHADPDKQELMRQLNALYARTRGGGYGKVLHTGKAELMNTIPDAGLVAAAVDARHLEMLRALGLTANLCVPLIVHEQVLGTLSLATAESGRQFSPADVELIEELGRRAATAIENARLYRQLQLADRRKNEFLAMLGHELRNPLGAISNVVHVVKARPTHDRAELRVRDILDRQVQTMARLLDDLLDVSRITRGTVHLERQPVDLNTVIYRAVDSTRHLVEQREHTLQLALPPTPLSVFGDGVRLEQVVSNLLNNAVKYTPPGGQIWLTAEARDRRVSITIRDSGIGISPDFLPRVFDLFVQGERGLDRTEGGFGIGLTLVRSLVEMHGGTIAAHSAGPGCGSEFVVSLPAVANSNPEAA